MEVACTGWIDLLGYGAMIARGAFNPTNPEAECAIKRIRQFHEIVRSHSRRIYLPTFVRNDGGVVYRDLSPRSRSVTYDFVTRALKLYVEINLKDRAEGHPGARMVIAAGFRARRNSRRPDKSTERLWQAVNEGRLSARQAISQAANFREAFDVIPELQANFAFSRVNQRRPRTPVPVLHKRLIQNNKLIAWRGPHRR